MMNKELFLKENCPDRHGTSCSKWDILPTKFGETDLVSMWVADMDFKVPEAVIETLREKVDFGIFGYTLTPDSYYDAFIKWEKEQHGWEIQKEWIRFTPGVVTGLFWFVHMCTKPGDSVILHMPVYYPFHAAIKDTDRNLVFSELVNTNGHYTIDFDDFEKKIVDNDVKLYIMSSPHNPVGRVWTEEELTRILEICRKHNVIVLSDEIHHDLIIGDRPHIPTATIGGGKYYDMVVTMTAPSKTFNLAGMKNSFVIIPDEKMRAEFDKLAVNLHETFGASLGYFAAEAAYNHGREWLDTVIDIIRDNYHYVAQRIEKDLPKAVLTPLEGTYLAWLDLSGYVGKATKDEMKDFVQTKARLAVDYGSEFGDGGLGFIRLNLATHPDYVRKAMDGLVAAANN